MSPAAIYPVARSLLDEVVTGRTLSQYQSEGISHPFALVHASSTWSGCTPLFFAILSRTFINPGELPSYSGLNGE